MHFVIPPGISPTAEGTLSQTPLLHLYVYVLDKELSGTLVLTAPTGARAVVSFADGVSTRAQIMEGPRITDRVELERAAVRLCTLRPETKFEFYSGHDLLAGPGEVPRIEPLAVIMACARACVTSPHAESTLRKLSEVSIGIANGATPERFRLAPEENALVGRLRKNRATLTELVNTSGVPAPIVRGLIYGMTITRHLDFGTTARPPIGINRAAGRAPMTADATWHVNTGTTGLQMVDRPPTRPPQGSTSSGDTQSRRTKHEERRATIEAKLASAPNEDHFQLLGVPRDATTSQIRDAYFEMAKSFHPDRLPKELHDLRKRLAQLFATVNAAYEVLSNEASRAEYVASLGSGPASLERKAEEEALVARVVDAAVEFQKAEILLRKRDLAGAEACARRAAEADPEEPSYEALLVWIEGQLRPLPPIPEAGRTDTSSDDLVARLDVVLKNTPDHENALFYRGMLHKHAGRIDGAYKDFRRVVQLNPKHIDAAREVRLYEMRHPPDPDEGGPGGGIFGKLFKKR